MSARILLSRTVIFTFIAFVVTETFRDENALKTLEGATEPDDAVTIRTAQGLLRGRRRLTSHSVSFASFENVPFAEPPVDNLRFKEPVVAKGWDGVRDATIRAPLCLQPSAGEEDCLYLNVHTSNTSAAALLPVMVYIHGGAFMSSTYMFINDVDLFMEQGVVMVTVNYRLGMFGFLSLGTEDVPGNAGLKDQVMALEWIRDNIASFGGDKDSVTVFGASAGGASVTLLQVSPMAGGLFHRAIAFAGTNFCDWSIQDDSQGKVEQLVNILGLDSSEDLLEQLRNTPSDTLVAAGSQVQPAEGTVLEDFVFAPVLEPTFEGRDAFLPMPVQWHYENGEFSDVPTMIGYASFEYAAFYSQEFLEHVSNPQYYIPSSWKLNSNGTLFEDVGERIKHFYFRGHDFNPEERDSHINGLNLLGDSKFVRSIDNTVRAIAKYSRNNTTYYYRFSYGGSMGNPVMGQLGLPGATHGDEMHYMFPVELPAEGSSDDRVSKQLVRMYTNFAKYGNPTPGPETTLLPTTWKPVTPDVVNYLEINEELTPGTDPDGHRTLFWRELKAYVDEQNNLTPDD